MNPKTKLIPVQNLQEGDRFPIKGIGQEWYDIVDEVVFKDGGRVRVHMNDYSASCTYEYGESVRILSGEQ